MADGERCRKSARAQTSWLGVSCVSSWLWEISVVKVLGKPRGFIYSIVNCIYLLLITLSMNLCDVFSNPFLASAISWSNDCHCVMMDCTKECFLLGVLVLNLRNDFVGCSFSFYTRRESKQLHCISHLHSGFYRLLSLLSAVIFFFPTWRAFAYLISSCSEAVLYLKKINVDFLLLLFLLSLR